MASSSSSSCPATHWKHEVFLSFRGEDTRDNFTSHLVSALRRKKIETFFDEELKRGDEISPALLNAIERSEISVIIFSKNYASSKWCFDELVKILQCQNMNGQIVIPVFYHVDPSDVRKQTRSFGEAFVEIEKRFKKMPEKVQKWRNILIEASNLSGWDSTKIRPEAELVDEIVKDILKKLKHRSVTNDFEGLIGIQSRIEQIKSLLSLGLPDFRIVGIWGMGGIGKTTIAGAIFNQISNEFEGKSFMANVREESERVGLVHLRARFLSDILEEDLKIGTPNIPRYIKERLQRMKSFIILDDVNKPEQLDFLAGGLNRFGPGSRIIVTTRDKQVLDKCGVGYIYEVERLDYHEANELFCNYAFRQDHCTEDLQALLESVRYCANGNPLALKVLGSSFCQKSKEEWKNMFHNLKQILDPHIYDLLKISYDELTWEEKNIFLDIACFFKGYDRNKVTIILGDRYSMHYGLKVLVDKSLITVSYNKLQMHDLLQEMGREIVRQECEKDPGKRSRLWYHEDVYRVLKKKKGTDSIEGIFLDLSKITDIHLDARAFAKMSNLRLLKFYVPEYFDVSNMRSKVHFLQGLDYLSDELRYLHWFGYPLKTLPSNFYPENLIELSMPYSKVEQLLEGRKQACKLKWVDLHHSRNLNKFLDPLQTPNLERINLSNCTNLPCIPSAFQIFNNLNLLCLQGCESLECFPRNVHFKSLITLNLSDCMNLTQFPHISRNIKKLDLHGTAIEVVPSSIECLTMLEELNMRNCTRLRSISTNICKLNSLYVLDLDNCSKLESFPRDIGSLSSLKFLYLKGNNFESLPELPLRLKYLNASNCKRLQFLPEIPPCLEELDVSVLETLSQLSYTSSHETSDTFSDAIIQFKFNNCPKLNEKANNNSLEDSQLRIQHMANASLKLFYEKEFGVPPSISIRLPGSVIPDWFSNRSSGSSITIQLPQLCCNKNFIGFAFCAVIEKGKDCRSYDSFAPRCSCPSEIKTLSETEHFDIIRDLSYSTDIDSDHVVLAYDPCWNFRPPDGNHYIAISFEFFHCFLFYGQKVKCCGVSPVFAHPSETQPNTFTVNMMPSTEEECRKLHNEFHHDKASGTTASFSRSDEEEVEPNPRRICTKQINMH